MSVESAVEATIEALGGDLSESAEAATALALARELDSGKNSATSKSMCAKALNDTMDRLRAMAPPKEVRDGVTNIADARARRQAAARGATATD